MNFGWICPRCGRTNAPWVSWCCSSSPSWSGQSFQPMKCGKCQRAMNAFINGLCMDCWSASQTGTAGGDKQ